MRIVTWNVNGLRAALRKGLLDHLKTLDPEVLLLQEIRCRPGQIDPGITDGWHVTWHPAQKPGYAGTAVWSRRPHRLLGYGLQPPRCRRPDPAVDPEGRVLRVEVGGVQMINVYLPSGGASPARQVAKEAWMAEFLPWASGWSRSRQPCLLAGDLNIAHQPIDLFHHRSNTRQSGFLPHERAWLTDLLDQGWTDTVRRSAGEVDGPYSWWSNRGSARALDRGWRIDYVLTNRWLTPRVAAPSTHRSLALARGEDPPTSDHAPISVDLEPAG